MQQKRNDSSKRGQAKECKVVGNVRVGCGGEAGSRHARTHTHTHKYKLSQERRRKQKKHSLTVPRVMRHSVTDVRMLLGTTCVVSALPP